MNKRPKIFTKLHWEIAHTFRYSGYRPKQRLIIWGLYFIRNILDILSGIIGILSLGIIQTWWGSDVSAQILMHQMKFHKENNGRETNSNHN
jgi:hypothetical protein